MKKIMLTKNVELFITNGYIKNFVLLLIPKCPKFYLKILMNVQKALVVCMILICL